MEIKHTISLIAFITVGISTLAFAADGWYLTRKPVPVLQIKTWKIEKVISATWSLTGKKEVSLFHATV